MLLNYDNREKKEGGSKRIMSVILTEEKEKEVRLMIAVLLIIGNEER